MKTNHSEERASAIARLNSKQQARNLFTNIGENEIRREIINARRRERDQAMRDIGMVKVRGNLGGTYWE